MQDAHIYYSLVKQKNLQYTVGQDFPNRWSLFYESIKISNTISRIVAGGGAVLAASVDQQNPIFSSVESDLWATILDHHTKIHGDCSLQLSLVNGVLSSYKSLQKPLNSPESTENTEELVKRISDLRDSGNECLDAAWSMFIMANGPYTASCILLLGIPTEFTLFTRLTNNTFDYIATLTGETVPPLTEALRLIYPKCEIHPRLEGTFQRAILAFRA